MRPEHHQRSLSTLSEFTLRCGMGHSQAGLQLLELLIAVAIISILAFIAIPSYSQYRDKANNANAEGDLHAISQAIERFYTETDHYPDALADVRMSGLLDP